MAVSSICAAIFHDQCCPLKARICQIQARTIDTVGFAIERGRSIARIDLDVGTNLRTKLAVLDVVYVYIIASTVTRAGRAEIEIPRLSRDGLAYQIRVTCAQSGVSIGSAKGNSNFVWFVRWQHCCDLLGFVVPLVLLGKMDRAAVSNNDWRWLRDRLKHQFLTGFGNDI